MSLIFRKDNRGRQRPRFFCALPRRPRPLSSTAMSKALQALIWLAVSALGAGAVAFSAFHQGETINALWLVVAGLCSFAVAYRFYSKWLMTKVLVLDAHRAPPSVTHSTSAAALRGAPMPLILPLRLVTLSHRLLVPSVSMRAPPRAPGW